MDNTNRSWHRSRMVNEQQKWVMCSQFAQARSIPRWRTQIKVGSEERLWIKRKQHIRSWFKQHSTCCLPIKTTKRVWECSEMSPQMDRLQLHMVIHPRWVNIWTPWPEIIIRILHLVYRLYIFIYIRTYINYHIFIGRYIYIHIHLLSQHTCQTMNPIWKVRKSRICWKISNHGFQRCVRCVARLWSATQVWRLCWSLKVTGGGGGWDELDHQHVISRKKRFIDSLVCFFSCVPILLDLHDEDLPRCHWRNI